MKSSEGRPRRPRRIAAPGLGILLALSLAWTAPTRATLGDHLWTKG